MIAILQHNTSLSCRKYTWVSIFNRTLICRILTIQLWRQAKRFISRYSIWQRHWVSLSRDKTIHLLEMKVEHFTKRSGMRANYEQINLIRNLQIFKVRLDEKNRNLCVVWYLRWCVKGVAVSAQFSNMAIWTIIIGKPGNEHTITHYKFSYLSTDLHNNLLTYVRNYEPMYPPTYIHI
jgi:hypothetical protein